MLWQNVPDEFKMDQSPKVQRTISAHPIQEAGH
jgi:hypothetical protein